MRRSRSSTRATWTATAGWWSTRGASSRSATSSWRTAVHRATDMLRVLPQMVRLGSHRSVYDVVSRYIRDERLRQAFTFEPLLVGGNPFRTTSIYLLIHWLERKWGVHFARGGTTAIVHGAGAAAGGAWGGGAAERAGGGDRGARRPGDGRASWSRRAVRGDVGGEQRGSVVGLRTHDRSRGTGAGTRDGGLARAPVHGPVRGVLRHVACSTRS
jgi:hypothetical protein